MNEDYRMKLQSVVVALFLIELSILTFTGGCSGPALTSQGVRQSSIEGTSPPTLEQRDGLAYFLPLGRVHIVATRVDNLVTNYGLSIASRTNIYSDLLSNHTIVTLTTNCFTQLRFITNQYIKNQYVKLSLGNSSSHQDIAHEDSFSKENAGPTLNSSNGVVQLPQTTPQISAGSNSPAAPNPTNFENSIETFTTITTELPLVTTNSYYSVNITTEYRPDPNTMFILRPELDIWHDDTANISVDGNGLLQFVNLSNNDESGNIVAQSVQTAAQIFELVASGGISAVGGSSSAAPNFQTSDNYPFNVESEDLSNPITLANQLLNTTNPISTVMESDFTNTFDALKAQFGSVLREATNSTPDPDHLATFVESLRTELNAFINNSSFYTPFKFTNSPNFIQLRPTTLWIGEACERGRTPFLLQMYYRMVLEDAFPDLLPRFPFPWMHRNTLPPPQLIDVAFDPFDANELSAAAKSLSSAGLVIENASDFPEKKIDGPYHSWSSPPPGQVGGIYYRPALAYDLRIQDSAGNVASSRLLLPNISPVLYLKLDKNALVTRTSQVVLTNGMLCSYSLSKPSSAMAVANVGGTIVNGLTSSFTNLIQLKFNIATAANNLQNAALIQQSNQIANLNNQILLLSSKQKLASFTNSVSPNSQ